MIKDSQWSKQEACFACATQVLLSDTGVVIDSEPMILCSKGCKLTLFCIEIQCYKMIFQYFSGIFSAILVGIRLNMQE